MATNSPVKISSDLPRAQQNPITPPGAIKPMCVACEIREFTFCSVLRDEELDHLQAIVRRVRITSRQLLFQEGDDADNVYNILSGVLKLYKLLPDGRRQITGFVYQGDYLGIASVGTHSYSAEAVTEVNLCRFPRAKLYQLFDSYPALQSRLLGIATDELTAAQDQMLLLGRKTASEKLASFLLSLARRMAPQDSGRMAPRGVEGDDADIAGPIPVPMNRSDIADYLGLTMETVSRTLSRLKKAGHIAITDAHHIDIARPEALRNIAEGF
jgi:CRP/FNR family transcriptional regulator